MTTTRTQLQYWLDTGDVDHMERFVQLVAQGRTPAQAVRTIQDSDAFTQPRSATGYLGVVTVPTDGDQPQYVHKNTAALTRRSCDVKVWKTRGRAQRGIATRGVPDARVVPISAAHLQWGVWI